MNRELTIWHISDTHGYHHLLNVPTENIDLIIFSGDESNSRDVIKNEQEALDFLHWFSNLTCKYKIFVAGNHSVARAKGLITKRQIEDMGIIYLENDFVLIEGYKIWGSPYSPTFGDWSFMKARHKMQELWSHIDEDCDIVITHSPPKNILDSTYNRNGEIEHVGCKSLLNRLLKIKPLLHCSGHVHTCEDLINAGVAKLSNYTTIFSNGSVVTDRKFGIVTSHGNLFKLEDEKVVLL